MYEEEGIYSNMDVEIKQEIKANTESGESCSHKALEKSGKIYYFYFNEDIEVKEEPLQSQDVMIPKEEIEVYEEPIQSVLQDTTEKNIHIKNITRPFITSMQSQDAVIPKEEIEVNEEPIQSVLEGTSEKSIHIKNITRARKRNNDLSSRTPVNCPLCLTTVSRLYNLWSHFKKHKDFLRYTSENYFSGASETKTAQLCQSFVKRQEVKLGKMIENFNKSKLTAPQTCTGTMKNYSEGENLILGHVENSTTKNKTKHGLDVAASALWEEQLSCKKNCKTCVSIIHANKTHNGYLRSEMKDCKHLEHPCCCQKLFEESVIGSISNEEIDIDYKIHENFYIVPDPANNDFRYFCFACRRYPKAGGGRRMLDGGEYVMKGVSFKNHKSLKKKYLSRHLTSTQHLESLKLKDYKNATLEGKPTTEEMETATQNLCVAVQYLVDMGHSSCDLESLALLMNIVAGDDKPNPIGNRHHSTKNFNPLLKANQTAIKKEITSMFKEINHITKQHRKHTVALSKGTALHDITRQVIVTTYIDERGKHQEVLISAGRIFDRSAKGCQEHLDKACDGFIDTKDIVGICTGGESTYTGRLAGMHQMAFGNLQYDPRVRHLPDLCHKIEFLMQKDMPEWLKDTLEKSDKIAKNLAPKSTLSKVLHTYGNDDVMFTSVVAMSETRFVESGHIHIDSILRNIQMFLTFLPQLMYDVGKLSPLYEKTNIIYEIVLDPIFITRLLLANLVFLYSSLAEKEAQSHKFNPFDLKIFVSQLKSGLKLLAIRKVGDIILNFLETGILDYKFNYLSKEYSSQASYKEEALKNMKNDILQDFTDWVTFLLSEFDNYCEILKDMEKMITFFNRQTNTKEKKAIIIWCFKNCNLNFYPCGNSCKGFETCNCLSNEIEKFHEHFLNKTNNVYNEDLDKQSSELLSHYLDNANQDEKLNITNVCRLIEYTLLMKATQSSTERVHCTVSTTAKSIFDKNYVNTRVVDDMVDIIVFSKFNSNMLKLNAKDASKEFLKDHQPALCNTLPKSQQSKAVLRTRNILIQSGNIKDRCKKRKANMQLSLPIKKIKLSKNDMNKGIIRVNINSLYKETNLKENAVQIDDADPDDPDEIQIDPGNIDFLYDSNKLVDTELEASYSLNHPMTSMLTVEQSKENEKHIDDPGVINSLHYNSNEPIVIELEASNSSNHPMTSMLSLIQSKNEKHIDDPGVINYLYNESNESINTDLDSSNSSSHLTIPKPSVEPSTLQTEDTISEIVEHDSDPNEEDKFNEKSAPDEVYCLCQEHSSVIIQKDTYFVCCDNGDNCLSRLERLDLMDKDGGQWFHGKCVKFYKKKRPKNWHCSKCVPRHSKPPIGLRSILTTVLRRNNLRLTKFAQANKDNIYYVLSYDKCRRTGTDQINEIKFLIKNKLSEMLDEQYSLPEEEINSYNAIKLLLDQHRLVTSCSNSILTHFQGTNIDKFNMLVIFIYSAIVRKDIFILKLENDRVYRWLCVLKIENDSFTEKFVSLLQEKCSKFTHIVTGKQFHPDGKSYFCSPI